MQLAGKLARSAQRHNKQPCKFVFSVTVNWCSITSTDPQWAPGGKTFHVAWTRGSHEEVTRQKTYAPSLENVGRVEFDEDLSMTSTLYKRADDATYEEKKYKFTVFELGLHEKPRPVANLTLNFSAFVQQGGALSGTYSMEVVSNKVVACQLNITVRWNSHGPDFSHVDSDASPSNSPTVSLQDIPEGTLLSSQLDPSGDSPSPSILWSSKDGDVVDANAADTIGTVADNSGNVEDIADGGEPPSQRRPAGSPWAVCLDAICVATVVPLYITLLLCQMLENSEFVGGSSLTRAVAWMPVWIVGTTSLHWVASVYMNALRVLWLASRWSVMMSIVTLALSVGLAARGLAVLSADFDVSSAVSRHLPKVRLWDLASSLAQRQAEAVSLVAGGVVLVGVVRVPALVGVLTDDTPGGTALMLAVLVQVGCTIAEVFFTPIYIAAVLMFWKHSQLQEVWSGETTFLGRRFALLFSVASGLDTAAFAKFREVTHSFLSSVLSGITRAAHTAVAWLQGDKDTS